MYIVIENADASNSKLGTVNLPFDPIPETEAYLAAITSTGFSENKKKAIDAFFRGLISSGLKAKVTRIYLPVLGRVDGGVNMVNPAEANINYPTANAIYDANGVQFTASFTPPFNVNSTDLMLGFWNATSVASTGVGKYAIGTGNFQLGRRLNASFAQPAFILNSSDRATSAGASGAGIGLVLGSVKAGDSLLRVMVDGFHGVKTPLTVPTPATYPIVFSVTHDGPIKLHIFGLYLEEAEMTTLTGLIVNLIAGLSL